MAFLVPFEELIRTYFHHEPRYPATTDAKRLAYEIDKRHDAQHISVVFSTYHSIDVMIHRINDLLQGEFGQTLGSKGAHIIDPLTGTFITRLLQSSLIKPGELPHKYKHEIHANEYGLSSAMRPLATSSWWEIRDPTS